MNFAKFDLENLPGDACWSGHWLGGGSADYGRHLGGGRLHQRLCTGHHNDGDADFNDRVIYDEATAMLGE